MKSVNQSVDVEVFQMCPCKRLAALLRAVAVVGWGEGQDVGWDRTHCSATALAVRTFLAEVSVERGPAWDAVTQWWVSWCWLLGYSLNCLRCSEPSVRWDRGAGAVSGGAPCGWVRVSHALLASRWDPALLCTERFDFSVVLSTPFWVCSRSWRCLLWQSVSWGVSSAKRQNWILPEMPAAMWAELWCLSLKMFTE